MGCTVAAPWDRRLLDYDFGPAHPLAPVRVELTMALAEELGVLDRVDVLEFEAATDELLQLVHRPDYLDAVRRAGETLRPDPAHGLGTADDPVFAGMHEASALVAGASVAAARSVHSGTHDHGVSVSGGLHHAMPDRASGFCVYNDPAIAIAWLLSQGVERVAYVDIDVHHGDGVQAVFWDDPRVLTISLHESGRTLFPGTGAASEVGGPSARGTAINIPFEPGTRDVAWHGAFDAVVPEAVREFAPDYLVTQHGCDTHALDPLANLLLTVDGQWLAHAKLHDLAHEVCGGRWLAHGGGGYELVQVVPRTWTHLLAIATGAPVDPETPTPEPWREFVKRRTGEHAPIRMTDRPPTASGA
ncbi:MAG TPA: acetoin utilization protein AcuC [Mycobacteriales bacterium]|nr:acetoin utilization protein AcuC [Mycobacteriales bacterium]